MFFKSYLKIILFLLFKCDKIIIEVDNMGIRFKSLISKYLKKDNIKNEVSDNNSVLDKETLINQYLDKYKFEYLIGNDFHSDLLNYFISYHSLNFKTVFKGDTFKIYPAKISNDELEKKYFSLMEEMIDYHLASGLSMEEVIGLYTDKYKVKLKSLKEKMKNATMKPYYGSVVYMINRIEFISKCISEIPNLNFNIDNILAKIDVYEKKYLSDSSLSDIDETIVFDDEFFVDYDKLESLYLEALRVENELAPLVVGYWNEYLTDPCNHKDEYYKYVMHTFSGGMVDPAKMNKACCALNSESLVMTPYGNCGLIYEFDASAVDSFASEDSGSWRTTKDEFIDRGCPGRWQLTDPSTTCVWYEEPTNSKIVMPEVIEKENIALNYKYNSEILKYDKNEIYSEVFLNNKAKAVGVFYTDKCKNVDEVIKYAEKYNLPLVNISLNKQRAIRNGTINNDGDNFTL